jgi:hypothetical protein
VHAVVVSPEDQIRNVARSLLVLSQDADHPTRAMPRRAVAGLHRMIERFEAGDLPPIEVVADDEVASGLLAWQARP